MAPKSFNKILMPTRPNWHGFFSILGKSLYLEDVPRQSSYDKLIVLQTNLYL